jgi:hypothetical protein
MHSLFLQTLAQLSVVGYQKIPEDSRRFQKIPDLGRRILSRFASSEVLLRQPIEPKDHFALLQRYDLVVPHIISKSEELTLPTLRHPDIGLL